MDDAFDDPDYDCPGEPHDVPVFLLGAGGTITPATVEIDAERLSPDFGLAWRRIAYDILRDTHRSPGPPNPIDDVFGPVLRFEPQRPERVSAGLPRAFGLPSLLDESLWPGEPRRGG